MLASYQLLTHVATLFINLQIVSSCVYVLLIVYTSVWIEILHTVCMYEKF